MPIPWVEAVDVSNAVLYLASDESRYVTGTTMVLDPGAAQPFKIQPAGGWGSRIPAATVAWLPRRDR